jgi:hypothetical protein
VPNYTEIPVAPSQAQRFTITLLGVSYNMRLTYNLAQDACWILDVGDADGDILVAGIAVVSGVDLLAQYAYLGFGGGLFVTTDRGAGEVPDFDAWGKTAHLYFVES